MHTIISHIVAIHPQTSSTELKKLFELIRRDDCDDYFFLLPSLLTAVEKNQVHYYDDFIQWMAAHPLLQYNQERLWQSIGNKTLLSQTTLNLFADEVEQNLMVLSQEQLQSMNQTATVLMAQMLKDTSIFVEKIQKYWEILMPHYPALFTYIDRTMIAKEGLPLLNFMFDSKIQKSALANQHLAFLLSDCGDLIREKIQHRHLTNLNNVRFDENGDKERIRFVDSLTPDQKYKYVSKVLENGGMNTLSSYLVEKYPDSRYLLHFGQDASILQQVNYGRMLKYWKSDIGNIAKVDATIYEWFAIPKGVIHKNFKVHNLDGLKNLLDLGLASQMSKGGLSPAWCYMYFREKEITALIPKKWRSIADGMTLLNKYMAEYLKPLTGYFPQLEAWLDVRYTPESWAQEIGLDVKKIHKQPVEEEWVTHVHLYKDVMDDVRVSPVALQGWNDMLNQALLKAAKVKKTKKRGLNLLTLEGYSQELAVLSDYGTAGLSCENSDLRYLLDVLEKTSMQDFHAFFETVTPLKPIEHPMYRGENIPEEIALVF